MTTKRALRILADRRIAAGIADGAFDGLPGCGDPLFLEDDTFVPEEWRRGHRLHRRSGFPPAWIETGAEIRRGID